MRKICTVLMINRNSFLRLALASSSTLLLQHVNGARLCLQDVCGAK